MLYVGYGSNLDPQDWSEYCARPRCGTRRSAPRHARPLARPSADLQPPGQPLEGRRSQRHALSWRRGPVHGLRGRSSHTSGTCWTRRRVWVWTCTSASKPSPCCPTARSRRSSPTGSRKGSWPAKQKQAAARTCLRARPTSRRSRAALPTTACLRPTLGRPREPFGRSASARLRLRHLAGR